MMARQVRKVKKGEKGLFPATHCSFYIKKRRRKKEKALLPQN